MSALPNGMTEADVRAELRRVLEQDSVVDVAKEAESKTWAVKVKEWIRKSSSKS
jgi:hypothetical protein